MDSQLKKQILENKQFSEKFEIKNVYVNIT
jgi:hypothetical protein